MSGRKKQFWNDLPGRVQLSMGLLAVAVVQFFRPENAPLLLVAVETLLYLAIPVLLLFFWGHRFDVSRSSGSWHRNVHFQLVGLFYTLAPLASQAGMRSFGYGDAYELVAILCVLNLAWYFTLFSKIARSENVAFILNSSVALFVCFATQQVLVYLIAFVYALTALWWLVENYWNRLIPKKLDAETRSLPIRGFAFGLTLILLVASGVIAAAAGPMSNLIVVQGFMPSSGGENGHDDMFARSGVGDGDMLTTGENATTVGAVDTDQFIEDKKPSIYDVVSEKYDGPVRVRKKMTSAQSLDAIAKHVHKVKNAEQAGKTFRTVRKSRKVFERELEDRISDALFFVEGPVPTRFRVDCFHHFDGWDWTKSDVRPPAEKETNIALETHHEHTWFVLKSSLPEFMAGEQHHRVKILRLESSALPAAPFLKAWHIFKVDQEGLFKWDESEMIRFRRETIPSQTVIDTISQRANLYSLRKEDFESFHRHTDPNLAQLPDNPTSSRIRELADQLTRGISPGWRQVEAITNHLRLHFELAENQVPDPDCEDTVGWFLEQGAGPSYLFATTAVQLLRAAGYQTRLASGFVVEKKDYVRKSGQSIVTHENYHMWPEVCFDSQHWIPVEPTPGYTQPVRYGTLWQRTESLVLDAIRFVFSHPLLSGAVLFLFIALVVLRRSWIAFLFWCCWLAMTFCGPGTRLRQTRQLIDARLWLFGVPRPSFVVIRNWFRKIDSDLPDEFFRFWNQRQFGNSVQPEAQQVERACRVIVSRLSPAKIREFVLQQND
ncbi:MAG: transglutaminase-like domain-containing protein [Planctomycetota bacterium]|nr:transglutaminase-like domain-containing protein [Planctomycetota bacterium]